jgi:hypothetical protein
MIRRFWKRGVETYIMSPTSPINLATYIFSLGTCGRPASSDLYSLTADILLEGDQRLLPRLCHELTLNCIWQPPDVSIQYWRDDGRILLNWGHIFVSSRTWWLRKFQKSHWLSHKKRSFICKLKRKLSPAWYIVNLQPQLVRIRLFGRYSCKIWNCGFNSSKHLMSYSAPDAWAQARRHRWSLIL